MDDRGRYVLLVGDPVEGFQVYGVDGPDDPRIEEHFGAHTSWVVEVTPAPAPTVRENDEPDPGIDELRAVWETNPDGGLAIRRAVLEPQVTYTGGWAVLELMGRRRLAGRVQEITVAGAPMLRVEVPGAFGRPPVVQMYSPSAVYSITPCDEPTARQAAVRLSGGTPAMNALYPDLDVDPPW